MPSPTLSDPQRTSGMDVLSIQETKAINASGIHFQVATGVFLLAGLYGISQYNYLLFHALAECFSVAVAVSVFFLVWNARHYTKNDALVCLGIAWLFIGCLDLIHTLAYRGMGVFPNRNSANMATQLWIAARGLEAVSLVLFPFLLNRQIRACPVFATYGCVTALLLASILVSDIFPVCYVEDIGLTPFKIWSEYVICMMLAGAVITLYLRRTSLDAIIFRLMTAAICVTILSELTFTIYVDVYGLANLVGHMFKIVAFYLIYLAQVHTGITQPFSLLFRDIAARENMLQRMEAEQRKILDHIPDVVVLQDMDGHILWLNETAQKSTGKTRSEIVGQRCHIIWQGYKTICNACPVEKSRLTHVPENAEVQTPDGRIWDIRACPMFDEQGQIESILEVAQDITQRKETENALRQSRENYQSFLTHTSEGIYRMELDTPVEIADPVENQIDALYDRAWLAECNQAFVHMYGQNSPDELTGKRLIDFHGGRDHPVNRNEVRQFVLSGYRIQSENTLEQKADGQMRWFSNATVGIVEDGVLVRIWGTQTDITDRKNFEAERERLLAAIHQSGEIVIVTDADGMIQYVNPAFEAVTGYSRAETVGVTPRILKSGVQGPEFYQSLWQTIQNGHSWKGRLVNRKKDGTRYTEDASISPVCDDTGKIVNYVAVKRDITEELAQSQQLQHALKMEAIGTLSGGIAHDFNNILASIVGYAEIVRDDLPENLTEARFSTNQILKAGARARDLIGQIMAFSRKKSEELGPVQMGKLVEEALRLLKSALPSTVRIDSSGTQNGYPVLANETRIHQMIMNLLTNAWQSMGASGGLLTVQLSRCELGPSDTSDLDLQPGGYVRLRVRDTGAGISGADMSLIFDPFFTTKTAGKGTGLGLAVVYGVVKAHHGGIRVESTPGQGTTFDVFLPEVTDNDAVHPDESPVDVPHGSGRILIVDDEETILDMAGRILMSLGYHVTIRAGVIAAWEHFCRDPDKFDLIITDLTMPDMTGDILAEKIHSIRPDIPVILCTGYGARIPPERYRQIGFAGMLSKPMTKAELATMVHTCMKEGNYGRNTDHRR